MFKLRNYDPQTRTIRKRALGEEDEDTVEKAVEGLAERIIAGDEERRAQDLVSTFRLGFFFNMVNHLPSLGPV